MQKSEDEDASQLAALFTAGIPQASIVLKSYSLTTLQRKSPKPLRAAVVLRAGQGGRVAGFSGSQRKALPAQLPLPQRQLCSPRRHAVTVKSGGSMSILPPADDVSLRDSVHYRSFSACVWQSVQCLHVAQASR